MRGGWHQKVIISGIIYRKDPALNTRRMEINRLTAGLCKNKGFDFYDHGNIEINHLWDDGIHLNQSGLDIFAKTLCGIINTC